MKTKPPEETKTTETPFVTEAPAETEKAATQPEMSPDPSVPMETEKTVTPGASVMPEEKQTPAAPQIPDEKVTNSPEKTPQTTQEPQASSKAVVPPTLPTVPTATPIYYQSLTEGGMIPFSMGLYNKPGYEWSSEKKTTDGINNSFRNRWNAGL